MDYEERHVLRSVQTNISTITLALILTINNTARTRTIIINDNYKINITTIININYNDNQ